MRFLATGILVLWLTHTVAQPANTEIMIIGTIHTGTAMIHSKHLIEQVNRFQPQLILWEQPDGYKPIWGMGIAKSLGIAEPSIEQDALQTILRKNKAIRVEGYDTTFERRAHIKDQDAMWAEILPLLDSAFSEGKMSAQDAAVYRRHMVVDSAYIEFIQDTTLERINRADIIQVSRMIRAEESSLMVRLTESYTNPELAARLLNNIRFWEDRNAYMCRKIREWVGTLKPQRIVVLTGLDHKYYLTDCLKNSFSLKELQ